MLFICLHKYEINRLTFEIGVFIDAAPVNKLWIGDQANKIIKKREFQNNSDCVNVQLQGWSVLGHGRGSRGLFVDFFVLIFYSFFITE